MCNSVFKIATLHGSQETVKYNYWSSEWNCDHVMKDDNTCAQLLSPYINKLHRVCISIGIYIANYIVAVLGIMGNGNDPPTRTINLESSDEKHVITK